MPALVDEIARVLEDPADVALARSILGSDDPTTIAASVERFFADLGRTVIGCTQFTQSVGAVVVVDLDAPGGATRAALKIHALVPGAQDVALRGFRSLGDLEAVYRAQQELAVAGVPCATVLAGPRMFDEARAAAVMSVLDAPRVADAHAPDVRQAMTRELARIVELGRSLHARDALPRASLARMLFPAPHNALFDFSRPGGEWIDDRARRAREVLDLATDADFVVMHTDFSAANVRTVDGRVVAIYDMDSVAWIDEMRGLASAAVHYTYAGDPPWTWPSRHEACAYVAEYLAVRNQPLDARARARLDAAAIYSLAYTARCEHGLGDDVSGMRDVLADAPDAYFAGI